MQENELYEARFHYERNRGMAGNFLFLAVLCLVILGWNLVFGQIFKGVLVSGSSMEPTLQDGDFLFVDPYCQAERGDIVVIDVSAYREEQRYSGDYIIKRLIGLEGDRIYCQDGVLYICRAGEEAFTALEEPYLAWETADFPVVTVGESEIFFLGDNRPVSLDSRIVGCYLASDIYGVVTEWSYALKGILRVYYTIFA